MPGGAHHLCVAQLWDHAGVADSDSNPGAAPHRPVSTDDVALRIPADPDYAAIARTAAMALGLRAGFTWPTLTALAVAVDESLILLLTGRQETTASGTVDIAATVSDGHLELAVGLTAAHALPSPGAIERFDTLVGDAVDHWAFDAEHHQVLLGIRESRGSEPPAAT